MGKRAAGDPPAVPDAAHHVLVGHSGIAQKDLVERRTVIHLMDWSGLNTHLVHIE